MIRFGIVGMGIGKAQGRAIAADPRTRVAALCDLDTSRMEAFRDELEAAHGEDEEPIRLFTRYEDMCRDEEIDAVFVGTPNQLHVPVALEAVRNGKHVLCTKPLSDSEDAARELVRAAEASGVVNMMSLSLRFGGPMQHLGRLARSGRLGEIYFARARSVRRSGIPDWGAHFVRAGGGAFRDMGVHVLDAAWWMAGCPDPVTVSGTAGAKFGPRGLGYWDFRPGKPELAGQYASDDYGVGLIRFANGAAIHVESFWASHQPDELQIELFGTEGGARLEPLTVYRTEDGRPVDCAIRPLQTEGFAGVTAHFAECVLDGVPCQAPLRHGLAVQRMLEAVLSSARSGEEVRLD